MAGEVSDQPRACTAARDFPDARLKVAGQIERCSRSKRRNRRKTINRRYVRKNLPHAITTAVPVTSAQRTSEAFSVGRRVPGEHEISRDLGGHRILPLGIQRVAAE